jgi:hypothetical protein
MIGPQELTAPPATTSKFACNTTVLVCMNDRPTNLDVIISNTQPEINNAGQPWTPSVAAGIMGPQSKSETDDYNIKAAIADCSSYSAANPVNDGNGVSATSISQGGKQSRTITNAFGVATTIVVDLDEVRQMMQTCFPAATGVDSSIDSGVLNSWISLHNLSTPMSDNAGHKMG